MPVVGHVLETLKERRINALPADEAYLALGLGAVWSVNPGDHRNAEAWVRALLERKRSAFNQMQNTARNEGEHTLPQIRQEARIIDLFVEYERRVRTLRETLEHLLRALVDYRGKLRQYIDTGPSRLLGEAVVEYLDGPRFHRDTWGSIRSRRGNIRLPRARRRSRMASSTVRARPPDIRSTLMVPYNRPGPIVTPSNDSPRRARSADSGSSSLTSEDRRWQTDQAWIRSGPDPIPDLIQASAVRQVVQVTDRFLPRFQILERPAALYAPGNNLLNRIWSRLYRPDSSSRGRSADPGSNNGTRRLRAADNRSPSVPYPIGSIRGLQERSPTPRNEPTVRGSHSRERPSTSGQHRSLAFRPRWSASRSDASRGR